LFHSENELLNSDFFGFIFIIVVYVWYYYFQIGLGLHFHGIWNRIQYLSWLGLAKFGRFLQVGYF
jgi:hypothetical protein